MLTLKQCKDNAATIAKIMGSTASVEEATRSINSECGLCANESDLLKLLDLRVNYPKFDLMFTPNAITNEHKGEN